MGVLQDQCPEEDFETIKAIVSKELDFDAVFASFEEKPIGAASIGQGTTSYFRFLETFIYGRISWSDVFLHFLFLFIQYTGQF